MEDVLLAFILSAPIQEDATAASMGGMDHPGKEQLAGDTVAYAECLYVTGALCQAFVILT